MFLTVIVIMLKKLPYKYKYEYKILNILKEYKMIFCIIKRYI